MGTLKQIKLNKEWVRNKTAAERKAETIRDVANKLHELLPNLIEAALDWESPVNELKFYIKDAGSFLVICKRDKGVKEEILFSGGEDLVESLVNVDRAIGRGKWRESTYLPQQKGDVGK